MIYQKLARAINDQQFSVMVEMKYWHDFQEPLVIPTLKMDESIITSTIFTATDFHQFVRDNKSVCFLLNIYNKSLFYQ